MARKPKNANIDIRHTARVFDEQAFVDGVFNDDYILVVGSYVILDRKQFPHSKDDINQYIIEEINNDRREVQTDIMDHKGFTDIYPSFGTIKKITGFCHTHACCLRKLRSRQEAGKKQPRVWLQYGCSVAEVLFDRRSNRVENLWCSERLFHDSNKRNRLLYIHAESVKILHFRRHLDAQSKDYSYLCTVKTN